MGLGQMGRCAVAGIVVAAAVVAMAAPTSAATRCVAKAKTSDGTILDATVGSAVALSPITACQNALKSCAADLPESAQAAKCEVVEATETQDKVTVAAVQRRPAEAVSDLCNIDACRRAYRSFRASDCTFQPNRGPRRLCTKTDADVAARRDIVPRETPPAVQRGRRAAPRGCNITACSRAYRTFRASDCTYQPSSGPRRLCTKGFAGRSGTVQVFRPRSRGFQSCNVSACRRSYSTFRASDCTYRTLFGARRLCRL